MLYDILKEKGFTFTNNVVTGPSYIMPDGLFLDLQKANADDILPCGNYYGIDIVGHPDLFKYILNVLDLHEDLVKDEHAIKINDANYLPMEVPYVTIPTSTLTLEQMSALRSWLTRLLSKDVNKMYIGYKNDRRYIEIDLTNTSIEDIVLTIYDITSNIENEDTN